MSDSEAESSRHSSSSNSGESLKQDHMSVSEHELEQCHEDDSIGICDDGDSDSELSPGERFGALPAVQTGVKTQDAAVSHVFVYFLWCDEPNLIILFFGHINYLSQF